MKVNSISRVPLDKSEFYKSWLTILKPFHGLSARQIDVASIFLAKRAEIARRVSDPVSVDKLLLTTEVRGEIREEAGISKPHFQLAMTKLRRSGFLTSKGINIKYIPDIEEDATSFGLLINFDFNDTQRAKRDNKKRG